LIAAARARGGVGEDEGRRLKDRVVLRAGVMEGSARGCMCAPKTERIWSRARKILGTLAVLLALDMEGSHSTVCTGAISCFDILLSSSFGLLVGEGSLLALFPEGAAAV
jgi:hypothetical protein